VQVVLLAQRHPAAPSRPSSLRPPARPPPPRPPPQIPLTLVVLTDSTQAALFKDTFYGYSDMAVNIAAISTGAAVQPRLLRCRWRRRLLRLPPAPRRIAHAAAPRPAAAAAPPPL
jgi:hypothetical protein